MKEGRAKISAIFSQVSPLVCVHMGPLTAENTPPPPPHLLQEGFLVEDETKSNSPHAHFLPIYGFKPRPPPSLPPPRHLQVPYGGLNSALPPVSGFGVGYWAFSHESNSRYLCFSTRPASDSGVSGLSSALNDLPKGTSPSLLLRLELCPSSCVPLPPGPLLIPVGTILISRV